jgi:hypothetical protein
MNQLRFNLLSAYDSYSVRCVGAAAVAAAAAGRPEFGDLTARWDYFQATFNSNRVRDLPCLVCRQWFLMQLLLCSQLPHILSTQHQLLGVLCQLQLHLDLWLMLR